MSLDVFLFGNLNRLITDSIPITIRMEIRYEKMKKSATNENEYVEMTYRFVVGLFLLTNDGSSFWKIQQK